MKTWRGKANLFHRRIFPVWISSCLRTVPHISCYFPFKFQLCSGNVEIHMMVFIRISLTNRKRSYTHDYWLCEALSWGMLISTFSLVTVLFCVDFSVTCIVSSFLSQSGLSFLCVCLWVIKVVHFNVNFIFSNSFLWVLCNIPNQICFCTPTSKSDK